MACANRPQNLWLSFSLQYSVRLLARLIVRSQANIQRQKATLVFSKRITVTRWPAIVVGNRTNTVFHCKEQLGDFPIKSGRAETLLIDRHRALVPFNDDGKLSYKFLPVVGFDRMRIGDFAMLEPSRGRARFQGSSFWFQCTQKRQTCLSTF